MARRYLTTSQIARSVGVHPNTVRLYEEWGFLQPVSRSPAGYRQFTEAHMDQMRLARITMHGAWPGNTIRQSALTLVRRAASGDLGSALEQAYIHLGLVQGERAQAEAAAVYLEQWAQGAAADTTPDGLTIGQAAKLLNLTVDTLRSWERNGLIRTPRDPHNRYRVYRAVEIGRLRVIRMLRRSGFSPMAILRMMLEFDQGKTHDLRSVLDTPRPDEDIFMASDHWLSSLAEQEQRALEIIAQLKEIIRKNNP